MMMRYVVTEDQIMQVEGKSGSYEPGLREFELPVWTMTISCHGIDVTGEQRMESFEVSRP